MPEPYYFDDSVTLYHGDCREILPSIDPSTIDLVLSDPPYGINVNTQYNSSGRGRPSDKSTHVGRNRVARANNYPAVVGDDQPFDPSHLLIYKRLVLWGAQHYAHLLPPSGSWLVWDRVSGGSSTADADLAWTNLGGTVRSFTYQWNGAVRHGEKETHGYHPQQKPVALMRWIVKRHTAVRDLVLDPYMGSGPVAKACHETGRRYIGIEIEERYCEIAAKRLAQGVLEVSA